MAKKVKNTKKEVVEVVPQVEAVVTEVVNETVNEDAMEIIDKDVIETVDQIEEVVEEVTMEVVEDETEVKDEVIEVTPMEDKENNVSKRINRAFGFSWNGQEYEW